MLGRLPVMFSTAARLTAQASRCASCAGQHLAESSRISFISCDPGLPFWRIWSRTYARAASVRRTVSEPIKTDHGTTLKLQQESQEDDKLFRMIEMELKGHEDAVLTSYQWFLCQAAKELGIPVTRVYTPLRNYERFSLLKSKFIYKKHFVQYELRTYQRVIQLKYLTGSTADTYLEYVQRNLPEGVAMKVLKCQIEEFPSHLTPPESEKPQDVKT
ncbi:28S ribosomal protein S10, mitochondrial-like [Paramacrobiotus metropolitanus]|uniref:28S ribosomal protein S10, mitochondrial-like n=1 Tax=Paramacrobiotus metropolitanus TaxID=2943436 RepID=UPI002445AEBF|nr:28S ribosomal protein S10, mitochondrial-like [Paramacrobiotus metropolitanus]